jgi:hypothetical protein
LNPFFLWFSSSSRRIVKREEARFSIGIWGLSDSWVFLIFAGKEELVL